MNEYNPIKHAALCVTQMLRVSKSNINLSALREAIPFPKLPNIDHILASDSLDSAFENNSIETLARDVFRGFFLLASNGFTFTNPNKIREHFGKSLVENYKNASSEFIAIATSYWTFKIVHEDLIDACENLSKTSDAYLLLQLTSWLELSIASIFFPMPGIISISKKVREQAQRNIINKTGMKINEEGFIKGNPIIKRGIFG
jgi:hypothetical protein